MDYVAKVIWLFLQHYHESVNRPCKRNHHFECDFVYCVVSCFAIVGLFDF